MKQADTIVDWLACLFLYSVDQMSVGQMVFDQKMRGHWAGEAHYLFNQPNIAMEQRAFKNVNTCLNTNIYSYLETSGGQSSNPY
jgi:hypothetical protein